MKKIIVTATLMATLVFNGCTEDKPKTVEYYKAHIEEAQTDLENCKNEMMAAIAVKDKEAYKALLENETCKTANQAVKQHKRELARKRYEEERKKEEAAEAARKAEFEAQYKKELERLQSIEYTEFYALQTQCGFNSSRKPLCKAYQDLKESKLEDAVKTLRQKLTGDDLTDYHNKTCKKSYSSASCNVARTALKQAEEERVAFYVQHKEDLKKTFNQCYEKQAELRKLKKWNEANEYTKSFECRTVKKAAAEFKVYGFYAPIK